MVGGWPCLESHIKSWYADETDGETICTMDYSPQCGILKDDRKYYHTAPQATYTTFVKERGVETHLRQFAFGAGTSIKMTDTYQSSGKGHTQYLTNTTSTIVPIEQSHKVLDKGMGTTGYKNQPSVHVGQWECGRFSPEGSESGGVFNSFTDIEGEWEVHCKIAIGYDKNVAISLNGANTIKSVFDANFSPQADGGALVFNDSTWKFQGMHECTGTLNS